MLQPHLCVEALHSDSGRPEHAWTVANCLNIAAMLSKDQSDELRSAIKTGLETIRRLMARCESSGEWACSQDEFGALKEAVTLSDELQEISTRREMRDAIRNVMNEMAQPASAI